MTTPTIDYSQRAGNRPMPAGWQATHPPVSHTRDEWELVMADHVDLPFEATITQFFADISEYQPYVNSKYPYPVIAVRADTGYRTDNHLTGNKSYVDKHHDHIKIVPIYSVFIPGQSKQILQRLKNVFGSQCPPPYCPMTDMESGRGFAGPGDHSSEANDFVVALADWSSEARQLGYANTPDWTSNWSHHPSWMKRTLANYSSTPGVPSGYYARQYYGALPYGVPRGYPTSCAPFGSYVDMNVITRNIGTIVDDFGLDWLSMATQADVNNAVKNAIAAAIPDIAEGLLNHIITNKYGGHVSVDTVLVSIDKHVNDLRAALLPKGEAPVTPGGNDS